MSTSIRTGNVALRPGRRVAWVSEHGAHLVDYASYHLGVAQALKAVISGLAACQVLGMPEDVTVRAWLLAVLRRNCHTAPNYREGYTPGPGVGLPDVRLMERAWTLVDPLGVETLRLMYRHELSVTDLSHVLALPVDEVGKLATRTQDLIETLVSGLDALAHERHTCPDLGPLVNTLLAEEQKGRNSAEFDDARMALLSHMIKCHACRRPINIRYTVPQMISHPPVPPLTTEITQRFLSSLPPDLDLTEPAPGGTAPQKRRASGNEKVPRGGNSSPPPAMLPVVSRPGQETPLYDALLSQGRAREVLTRTGQNPISVTPPLPKESGFSLSSAEVGDGQALPVSNTEILSGKRYPRRVNPHVKINKKLKRPRVGPKVRTASLKVVIIVVAGAAGIVTGTNLLGPNIKTAAPVGSSSASAVPATVTASNAADQVGLGGRMRIPSVVTLDEFGLGSMTISVSGPSLKWRISAPGLIATPTSGTLKEGDTDVVTLRALRVRYWCGVPGPVTAPVTVDGPDESVTATVRWRTC